MSHYPPPPGTRAPGPPWGAPPAPEGPLNPGPWNPTHILLYGSVGVPLLREGPSAYTLVDWAMGAPPSIDVGRPLNRIAAHHAIGHALAFAWGGVAHRIDLMEPRMQRMVSPFEVAKALQDRAVAEGLPDSVRATLLDAAELVLKEFSR